MLPARGRVRTGLIGLCGLAGVVIAQAPPASAPTTRPTMNASQRPFATDCGQWYGLFNLPSAQHYKGKTYVVYPDRDQNPIAVCYDHATGKWSEPVVVGRKSLGSDDHGNPAMLIDRAGFIHVFYGCHGGPMHYARSAAAADISVWREQPDPAPHATYPQVMQRPDGKIDLFYRAGGHTADWVCSTSGNGGTDWGAQAALIHGVPPREAWYANFAKGPGGTVHVGFVWKDDTNDLKAPAPEFVHRYDVFHMQRDADGTWKSADGQALKLPLARADAERLCRAYDSRAKGELTGGCSVGVTADGRAALLFRVAGLYGVTTYQHKFAAWNGKAWDVTDIGPAVDCGFAEIVRDDNFLLQALPDNQLRAYVVNTVAGKPVRTDLEQWDSADGGRKWARKRVIFTSTKEPAAYTLIAPKLVEDAHPDAWLVFGGRERYLFGDSGFVGK